MREVRCFGPPGTGKTTWLAKSIADTVRARGSDAVVVGSFTRTAAAEISGRNLPIPDRQIGTLHSLAYRAIDQPELHSDHIGDWNARHHDLALTGNYKISPDDDVPIEAPSGGAQGDRLMRSIEVLRARMVPVARWPVLERFFYDRWSAWKTELGVIDFTDMIETALETTTAAPGNPLVGYFDEFQDFTPLEIALVRHWGEQMETLIVAGDDDQILYSFKGATPDAFLNPPVPEEDKRVLHQSWRVPAAVHRYAEQWIKQVAHREPKVYTPRDEEGVVTFATDLSLDKSDSVVSAVVERIDSGRTVMLLTTCAYLLEPVIAELRRRGVPFGNQYRESRSQWNPLGGKSRKSPADRLDAYLVLDERIYGERSRLWTGMDIAAWGACLRADGVFKRGVKSKLKGLPQREMTYEEVEQLFASPEALEAALEPSLAWFRQNIAADKRGGLAFPLAVAENRSPLELTAKPRVTIGTVHSVKGGEADSVFVFPDLSMAGMKQWESIQLRDSVIRQMYVAFTRPRYELVICEASTDRAVDELTLKRFR